jgi:CHAT domain-containing protein/tetratricopeptide (TPR) repeat protein
MAEGDLLDLHFSLGMAVRNEFLWGGNEALLRVLRGAASRRCFGGDHSSTVGENAGEPGGWEMIDWRNRCRFCLVTVGLVLCLSLEAGLLDGLLGRQRRGLSELAETVSLPPPPPHPRSAEADVRRGAGVFQLSKHRYAEALEAFRQAAATEKALGKPRWLELAICCRLAGNASMGLKAVDDAIAYYQLSLAYVTELRMRNAVALSCKDLSAAYSAKQDDARAVVYAKRALGIARKLGERKKILEYLQHTAEIHLRAGNLLDALSSAEEALKLSDGLQNNHMSTVLNCLAGDISREMGKEAEAKERYEKARFIANREDEGEWQNEDLPLIARINDRCGRSSEAVELYVRCLEEVDDPHELREATERVNWLALMSGDTQKSVSILVRCVRIHKARGRGIHAAVTLSELGSVYLKRGIYGLARSRFEEALRLCQESEDRKETVMCLSRMCMVSYEVGDYSGATRYGEKATEVAAGDETLLRICYNNLGAAESAAGRYDRAMEQYTKALEIAERHGMADQLPTYIGNMGSVYMKWGAYDKAMEFFRRAEHLARQSDRRDKWITHKIRLGKHASSRDRSAGKEHLEEALGVARETGRLVDEQRIIRLLASMHGEAGRYEDALRCLEFCFGFAESARQLPEMASVLNSMGGLKYRMGDEEGALACYGRALAVAEQLADPGLIETCWGYVGSCHYELADYGRAASAFGKAVGITADLRLTARGMMRVDYQESVLEAYRHLVSCHIRSGVAGEALRVQELATASFLEEEITKDGARQAGSVLGSGTPDQVVPPEMAVVYFANVGWHGLLSRLAVSSGAIYGDEVDMGSLSGQRGMTADVGGENPGAKARLRSERDLERSSTVRVIKDAVDSFRLLVSRPGPPGRRAQALIQQGQDLYCLLFSGLEELLVGKRELLIVPGGVLALLPFEALIMPDGRYLIEEYHIRYTQSLAVLDLLGKRQYPEDRKPLLAFGGAVYDGLTHDAQELGNERQLEALRKRIAYAMSRGRGVRNAYGSLGLGEWEDLPGSLSEVTEIGKLYGEADVHTGEQADESAIKELSEEGKLKQYRVLHFATHGLVVPEMPELSALVLSQFKEERNGEDGYLRVKEIAELDLQADFVNLSACDTGLGKMYGGEGVVGLTHSFLIAGANGLSVSLWSVDDDATTTFMVGMYKLVKEKGLSYSRAMTEMKRAFIAGKVDTGKPGGSRGLSVRWDQATAKPNRYSSPYHWAPFVYYGSSTRGVGEIVLTTPASESAERSEAGKGDAATAEAAAIEEIGNVLPSLAVEQIAKVLIRGDKGTVTILRGQGIWVITEKHGYPADLSTLHDLLVDLKELRDAQKLKIGPEQYGDYQLLVPGNGGGKGSGTQVVFFGDDDRVLGTVLLGLLHMRGQNGKPTPSGETGMPDGRYILLPTTGRAVLARKTFSSVEGDPMGWIDKSFFEVEDIREASLQKGGEILWQVRRKTVDEDLELVGEIPLGKEANAAALSGIRSAFSWGSFDDVAAPSLTPEETGMDKATIFTAHEFDGSIYRISVGGEAGSGGYYTQVAADYGNPTERGTDGVKTRQEIEEVADRVKGWTYIVSKYRVDSVLRTRDGLLRSTSRPKASKP